MDRILKDSRSQITITLYDGETATDADALPTIEILRENGDTLVAAGTNTTDEAGTGIYSYTLTPTHTENLDVLTAKWSATIGGAAVTLTTQAEIVSGFYFSLADLRATPNLSDTSKYTTAELASARDWISELIDREVGTSFTPKYHRDVQDGSGCSEMWLDAAYPRSVIGVRVNGTDFTADELDDLYLYPTGCLLRDPGSFATGYRNVEVRYEAGMTTVPADLHRAALVAARHRLLKNENSAGHPANSRTVTNEFGNFSLSYPGPGHPTGIDEVDAVINAYKARLDIPIVA